MVVSSSRRASTQRRIEAQKAVVARLTVGTPEHRIAVRILRLLQDCLRLMQEVDELKAKAQRTSDD